MNTHFQGKITEQQVALEFLKKGILVSQPLIADSRYDFIVDIKNKLYRIQVKTSTERENGNYFDFATSSSHTNTTRTINRSYDENEIDYFATIYKNECYLISVKECGKRSQRLRIVPPINGNQRQTKMAKDYTLKKFLETLDD